MHRRTGTPGATDPAGRRAGHGRALRALLAVILLGFGLPLLTMGPASAHTPSISATCQGVTVTGTAYEAKDTNTLGVRIDNGPWTTKTFATGDSLTVPVPQDGVVHTYNAYVHTTNPNQGYSHDYSGNVGPCGKKHVTAVLWGKTDPTCAADGALVPATEPAGITVQRSPSGTGPGHYTITFVAQSGYAIDGPTSQTIDVLPKLTGDVCATVVQPVAPTVTQPTCTGPGTGTTGSVTLPEDGNGLSYTQAGNVVTATADSTHKFGSLPAGWTAVDAHHATYTVTFTSPAGYPECLVEVPVPAAPVPADPTCDTDGDLVVGPTDHVVTTVDNVLVTAPTHFGPGSHQVSYAPAPGYAFAQGATTSHAVLVGGRTLDCPVTPVSPTVTQAACTGPGTHSGPVVALGDVPGDHIGYQYDEVTQVVTATPEPGFALADLPTGWVSHDDGTATFHVDLVDPGPCLVQVDVPTPPVPSAPTCSVDGALVVVPSEHVVTTVDDEVVEAETSYGPGTHTVAYAPAPGYTFGEEVQTSFDVTVLPSTKDCPASVVSPTVTQSVCTATGGRTDPVVHLGDVAGDHVSYAYDAGSHLVTATPDSGFALAELPSGWTPQEDGTATFAVALTDPGPCTVVSPPTEQPTVTVQPPKAPHHPSVLPDTGAPGDLGRLAAEGALLLLTGGGLLLWRRVRG